jgi:hypothetical protein
VTDARIEKVYVDRQSAREFLEQAEIFMADADVDSLNAISRNEASYAAALVPAASLSDAQEATIELIEIARRFVGGR